MCRTYDGSPVSTFLTIMRQPINHPKQSFAEKKARQKPGQ
jgi:hypothetical protein